MQRERKNGNPLNLPARCHFKHGAYWYVHALSGKWENLGGDIDKARHKAEHYNHGPSLTMDWYIDAFLLQFEQQVKLEHKAPRTLTDYEHYAVTLKNHFGTAAPADIGREQVVEFLNQNQQQGRGVRANREKALLSSIYSWLISQGQASVNPCIHIPSNSEKPRQRYVTHEEYHAVFQAATPAIQLALELAYVTLQNPASIVNLRRKAIEFRADCGFLHLNCSKDGSPVQIALHGYLLQHLRPLSTCTNPTDDFILVSRLGKPYSTSGIAAMLHRYQQRAQVAPFGLQDIKVKGALDLANSGTPLLSIANLLGHRSISMTQHYLNLHRTKSV